MRLVHGRLQRAGALQSAGNDRYYLPMDANEQYRGRRQVRAWIIVTVLLFGVATVYFSEALL